MLLVRYFLYVGGALLALLVVADTFLPKTPAESLEPNRPKIRLYSDQRWPERIVLDTSAQTIISSQPSEVESDISLAPAIAAKNSTREEAAQAGKSMSTKEAFAELRPNNTLELQSANPKTPKPEYERKIAKRHTPQMRLVWRQPYYGWSGSRYWW